MSYIAYRDHIAITTGDKSTTRSKILWHVSRFGPLASITLRD